MTFTIHSLFVRLICVAFASHLLGIFPSATAGVTDSHHDIVLFGEEEGAGCGICHGIFADLAESADYLFSEEGEEGLGPVGQFCYSCHDGSIRASARIIAPDGSFGLDALRGGHGFTLSAIADKTGGFETDASLTSSGLLSQSTAFGDKMDCTACHDPHAAQNPPFLRAPLEELCTRCHSGSDGQGRGRWTRVEDTGFLNGGHPIGMPIADSGQDHVRNMAIEQSFVPPDPLYDVPTYTEAELQSPLVHWKTGGHLLGPERHVSCVTCHSAHLPRENLLVAMLAEDVRQTICSGCHANGGDRGNPGVTPFGHPVFEASLPPYVHDHAAHVEIQDPNIPSKGAIDLFVQIPAKFPISPTGELECLSCHRTHQGQSGARCVRRGPKESVLICHECHGTQSAEYEHPEAMNWHHPTSGNDHVSVQGFTQPPWYESPGAAGDLTDGLQCTDCHAGLAKSGHNW